MQKAILLRVPLVEGYAESLLFPPRYNRFPRRRHSKKVAYGSDLFLGTRNKHDAICCEALVLPKFQFLFSVSSGCDCLNSPGKL